MLIIKGEPASSYGHKLITIHKIMEFAAYPEIHSTKTFTGEE